MTPEVVWPFNKKGKGIVMADDYSKSLDTQIQETQEKQKRSYKYVSLCLIMLFLGTFIINIIVSIFQIPNLEKVAIFWFVFWVAATIISVSKWSKSEETLRSKMAEKICIEDILNQYLEVEIFDPERAVDDEIRGAAGLSCKGHGHNYIKGKINGSSIETSYVHMDEGGDGFFLYKGQLTYLKNKCRFPGNVLLVRTGNHREYGMGNHYYTNLPKMLDGPPKSLIDALKEKDREQYRITITAGPLESQWEVFATDPEMARRLLDPHTELYRRLLDAPRLAFVYYCDDSIYFGGNYCFDLTKGTPEEVRAKVEEAMDGLIMEGVGTVLSAEYPAEGE